MQISNIVLTVLAAGASLVAAQDTTSGTTTSTLSLTKTVTVTSVSQTSVSHYPSVTNAVSSTRPTATAALFPAGNSTTGYATGAIRVSNSTTTKSSSTKASSTAATSSGSETESSTASASATSSSSAAAAGVQAAQGGLLLGALGALAMLL